MVLNHELSKASLQTLNISVPNISSSAQTDNSTYKNNTQDYPAQLRTGGRSSLGLNRKMEMQ